MEKAAPSIRGFLAWEPDEKSGQQELANGGKHGSFGLHRKAKAKKGIIPLKGAT